MLMFTHTWILRKFIGASHIKRDDHDIFAYNVSPDLLPVHKSITPGLTHSIPRLSKLPQQHNRAAFVQFHLLVDDMAHHGKISREAITEFNPNSNGYAYIKGKPLIQPITDFYREIGNEISFSETAYLSHMIIEMCFDLAIYKKETDLAALFAGALTYTVENKLSEFVKTLSWFFGIESEITKEAIKRAVAVYTRSKVDSLMSLEGRVSLFIDNYCYGSYNDKARNGIRELFNQGMDLVDDCEDFLDVTLTAINNSEFRYLL
ncbi:MAG: hypothetical protein Q7J27_05885 [Syntrophales bacterium]|nr:hypothetical protein [Syntrophales bacterium]